MDTKALAASPKILLPLSIPARKLLDKLPNLLRGMARRLASSRGCDIDTDDRDCEAFLNELRLVSVNIDSPPTILFRLAIEEMEACTLATPKQ